MRPGEEFVRPAGTPSKQSFGRLVARVQHQRRFKELEFNSLLDPGAETGLMSETEAERLSPGGTCPLEKGDYSVVKLADNRTQVQLSLIHI